jgi:hypothetical protein
MLDLLLLLLVVWAGLECYDILLLTPLSSSPLSPLSPLSSLIFTPLYYFNKKINAIGTGTWVDVEKDRSVQKTGEMNFVVVVGNTLARLSNGYFKSTRHRVFHHQQKKR